MIYKFKASDIRLLLFFGDLQKERGNCFRPIFTPLVIAFKVDLVWFGVIPAVNLQTTFLPPSVTIRCQPIFLKGQSRSGN